VRHCTSDRTGSRKKPGLPAQPDWPRASRHKDD
jgi:hypothetical protein